MQHVGEAARRDLQPERGPQQVGHLRQRHPHLRVQLHDQRDHPGTELHPRRAQRVGGLQHVAALHPPLTLRTVAPRWAPHDRPYHGQILRRHAGTFDRAAAIRARRGNRRRVGLVNPPGRGRQPCRPYSGPPSGTPAAPLRPVLGERRRLPATRPACLGQLLFQALDLPLLTLVLASQAVDLALLAVVLPLAPRQLFAEPLYLVAQPSYPFVAGQPVLVDHTRLMPYSRKKYNPNKWILRGHPLNKDH